MYNKIKFKIYCTEQYLLSIELKIEYSQCHFVDDYSLNTQPLF